MSSGYLSQKTPVSYSQLWQGFDLVVSRSNDARHDLKSIKQYLVDRASLEEEYARALFKLSKNMTIPKAECLSSIMDTFRAATESIGSQHSHFAQTLMAEIVPKLKVAKDQIKESANAMVAKHAKLSKDVKNLQNDHAKKLAIYAEEHKDAETAILNLEAGKKDNVTGKVLDKLVYKVDKHVQECKDAQANYADVVKQLKDAQVLFDTSQAKMLEEFERLDRARLDISKDELEKLISAHNVLSSNLDQTCSFLKKSVAQIDSDRDVTNWVAPLIPMENPPPHVLYKQIPSKLSELAKIGPEPIAPEVSKLSIVTNGSQVSGGPAQPNHPRPSLRPISPVQQAGVPELPRADRLQSMVRLQSNHTQKANESTLATISEVPILCIVKAMYSYLGEKDDDLTLAVGDEIEVLEKSDDGWWLGRANGREGVFPSNYVSSDDTPVIEDSNALIPCDKRFRVLFDFAGDSAEELHVIAGEILRITSEAPDWLVGYVETRPEITGLVPANYCEIILE